MPRLSARFVRASLAYLLIGFLFGALLLAQKGISYWPAVWWLFPIHVEFMLIGWLVQFAMGVAYWILPRFGRGAPRGSERPVLWSFWLLNAGVLLVSLQSILPLLAITGRALEAASVIAFAAGSWRRVKPHGA